MNIFTWTKEDALATLAEAHCTKSVADCMAVHAINVGAVETVVTYWINKLQKKTVSLSNDELLAQLQ